MNFDINRYEIVDYMEKETFYSEEGDILDTRCDGDQTIMWRAQFQSADIDIESRDGCVFVKIIDNDGNKFGFSKLEEVPNKQEFIYTIYVDDNINLRLECMEDINKVEHVISAEDTRKMVKFLKKAIKPYLNESNHQLPIHQSKKMCRLIKEIGDYFDTFFKEHGIDVYYHEEDY